jgi:peptidoglycan/xylan/chitin deacetylase (PgdA/CDA1 family)
MHPRVTNLCFHGVGAAERTLEPGEEEYWITESTFLGVLDLIAGRDDVRLSFDDGNVSDVAIGLPALRDRDLRGEFYVIAGRIGETGSLSSSDLREIRAAGMTIGSHGMHHRSWREAREVLADDEFDRARSAIAEASAGPVTSAACPLGLYDRRVLRELRERGYDKVMTSDRARADPRAWLQPRFSVRRHDSVTDVAALLTPVSLSNDLRSQTRMMLKRLR